MDEIDEADDGAEETSGSEESEEVLVANGENIEQLKWDENVFDLYIDSSRWFLCDTRSMTYMGHLTFSTSCVPYYFPNFN